MPTLTRTPALRRSLADHIVEAAGPWSEQSKCRQAQLLRLSDPDDEVILAGPLDLNLSIYAEHEFRGPTGTSELSRHALMSHDLTIPPG